MPFIPPFKGWAFPAGIVNEQRIYSAFRHMTETHQEQRCLSAMRKAFSL